MFGPWIPRKYLERLAQANTALGPGEPGVRQPEPRPKTAQELIDQAAANGITRDELVQRLKATPWAQNNAALLELFADERQRQAARQPRRGKITIQAYRQAKRKARTQKELAGLLRVSVRAVRNYERKLRNLAG